MPTMEAELVRALDRLRESVDALRIMIEDVSEPKCA
jgi:hypothetical protein